MKTDRLAQPLYVEDLDRTVNSALEWERLRGSTILISGASGMLGIFLADALMRANATLGIECRILAVARDEGRLRRTFVQYGGNHAFSIVPADVSQKVSDGLPQSDFVVHAASNTHPYLYATDPIGTMTANIQGTQNLLDYAVRSEARRFCFISTVEIYGENTLGSARFGEHDMGYLDSNTLRAGYPESKRAGEALTQAFRAQYGLDVVVPRLPRVFGPTTRANDTKAMSQFIQRAVEGKDIVLKSNGDQFYSYLYLADATAGLITCLLEGADGEAYNIAHPSCDIHLRELATVVAEVAGTNVVFDLPDETERKGYSTATTALLDGTKVAKLGWSTQYTVKSGVERTIGLLRRLRSDSHADD